jgi:hypothetical protein
MVVRQAGITQKLGSLVLYAIATVNSLGAATYKSAMDIDNILAPGNKVEDYGVRGSWRRAMAITCHLASVMSSAPGSPWPTRPEAPISNVTRAANRRPSDVRRTAGSLVVM